jgi:hypothetical protein
MSHKKKHKTPQWQWEETLLAAYYDHRWHQVLDPLYQQMQCWKRGELHHEDIDQAVHQTHNQTRELYGLFTQKRDFLILIAQIDQEWFQPWLAQHPAPSDTSLYQPPIEVEIENELARARGEEESETLSE